MTDRTFTALWLALMALGLTWLYHLGPWIWASRALSLTAAAVPAWALVMRTGHPHWARGALLVCIFLAGITILRQLFDDFMLPKQAGTAYALAYVALQLALTLAWIAWYLHTRDHVAAMGALFAGLGVFLAVMGHFVFGDPNPPAPWDRPEPVDILSLVWADGVRIEAIMVAVACMPLSWRLWQWFKG